MKVQGGDCSIVIKTAHRETDIPYAEETLREAFSLLQEEASIEGDGVCRAIRKRDGVTGCFVTPLTIGTAPLLLYLALGSAGLPVFISETRDLYSFTLDLLPLEDSDCFDLVQDRNGERKLYENCKVQGFELRFNCDEAVKLKVDICGERQPIVYPYSDYFHKKTEERFSGDSITCTINGKKYQNSYGVTIITKKENGTKTELWIKRSLERGSDIPEIIEEMTIEAQLLMDAYEYRRFGAFKITLKKLVLTSDETNINSTDTVIGPLRYYVSDTVSANVYTAGKKDIA